MEAWSTAPQRARQQQVARRTGTRASYCRGRDCENRPTRAEPALPAASQALPACKCGAHAFRGLQSSPADESHLSIEHTASGRHYPATGCRQGIWVGHPQAWWAATQGPLRGHRRPPTVVPHVGLLAGRPALATQGETLSEAEQWDLPGDLSRCTRLNFRSEPGLLLPGMGTAFAMARPPLGCCRGSRPPLSK